MTEIEFTRDVDTPLSVPLFVPLLHFSLVAIVLVVIVAIVAIAR